MVYLFMLGKLAAAARAAGLGRLLSMARASKDYGGEG